MAKQDATAVDPFEQFREMLQQYLVNKNPAVDNPSAAIPGTVLPPDNNVSPAPTTAPPDKKTPDQPKGKAPAPQVPTALTDQILNMGQIMPVIKAQVPVGLDGGKAKLQGTADTLTKLGKILQLFA